MTDTTAYDQSTYQIRFEWGAAGLARLAPAHITVLVDALPSDALPSDAAAVERPGGLVVSATLANRSAVAQWILERQIENGGRTSVNVIAAGDADEHGQVRHAVEDQLAAGALIDALIALGIDHTSPDAAVASAAFDGLKRACVHLFSASASGRLLRDAGRADELAALSRVDSSDAVDVVSRAA
ncbi:2-phosphosulfolactate phosphatase [Microbacteriaceae bacterium VKM Ac-2854]|nr:2-phosphosulfolactate phosphatase [Microbacteriaceae bacterium VKM Ac-2854]